MQQELSLTESFKDTAAFEHAQRVSKMMAASTVLPSDYVNNIPNIMIAMEMATRMQVSPMMVMQNMHIVHGKPSWDGKFIIALIKSSGLFIDVDFDLQGDASDGTLSCRMIAIEKKTGRVKRGTKVTWTMALAEGWVNKKGSKWQTMPEQMICYRAAAFFGRLWCPELLMGMQTVEEVRDFTEMATNSQNGTLEQLLLSSNYDEDTRQILREKINAGLTEEEATQMWYELKGNQLDPITSGLNYSQTDIKNHLNGLNG